MGFRFIVVGHARSGTGYTSRVLTRLGITCGHEVMYNHHSKEPSPIVVDPGLDEPYGDSSWMAVPFISGFSKDVIVFHQVRNPWYVVRSSIGKMPQHVKKHVHSFLQRNVPWYPKGKIGCSWDFWTRMWLYWNERVEQESRAAIYVRYRVDDMTPEFIHAMTQVIGTSVPVEKVKRVLEKVPKNYNTLKGKKPGMAQEENLDADLVIRLNDMMQRYGFVKDE